jgi:hypothetical protein
MVFAGGLGRVVLFGGGNDENADYADTWTWDGDRWSKLSLERSPRKRNHMAYTAVRGRPMIFGGVRDLLDYVDDTWTLRST